METLAALAASPHAAEFVLAVLVAEFCALVTLRGPARALDIAFALLPGACLLLAVRSALLGDGIAAAVWIAVSGPVHLIDLHRRGLIGARGAKS